MAVEEEIVNGEVVSTEIHGEEREVSKPAILGAPYSLETVNDFGETLSGLAAYAETVMEHKEDGTNEVEHINAGPGPEEETEVVPGYITVVATVIQLARDFETLQDNLTKLFKHLGHEAEWKKIINS